MWRISGGHRGQLRAESYSTSVMVMHWLLFFLELVHDDAWYIVEVGSNLTGEERRDILGVNWCGHYFTGGAPAHNLNNKRFFHKITQSQTPRIILSDRSRLYHDRNQEQQISE